MSDRVTKSARLRRLALALPALALAACAMDPVRLGPADEAELFVRLKPGVTQLVELEVSGLAEAGAEVSLRAGDIVLPPLYLSPSEFAADERNRIVASQAWSALWPLPKGTPLRIKNVGPGGMTLENIHPRRGSWEKLSGLALEHTPSPRLGWVDLAEIFEGKRDAENSIDPDAASQLASMKQSSAHRRRRAAFELIRGAPLTIRMGGPVIGDMQVRACQLGARGAIVAFSRPGVSDWKPLGPGWRPAPEEARWIPIPADRPFPRAFLVDQSMAALAIYAAGAEAADGAPAPAAALSARLFRMDTPRPLAAAEWTNLPAKGQWIELAFDPPLAPGEYVLELRATSGNPAWLAWNAVAPPAEGATLAPVAETLAAHLIPDLARASQAIPARACVVGWARQIDRYAGGDAAPRRHEPLIQDAEMIFEASLRPGETEIFHLRDYQATGGAN